MKHILRPLVCAMGLVSVSAMAATTITVAAFPDLDRSVKIAIQGYKKIKPDVEIKLVSLAYGDHHTAQTTALATGANLPDVMAVDMGFIGKFAESGGLEDLSKAPYNGLQYQKLISKFSFPQAMAGTGALAAIPCDIGPGTMFYRKDIMDKAGVKEADLTKSWESYIAAGKKVKAATGAYMIPHANEIMAIAIRSGIKDGDGLYFDKKGEPAVDSPRFVKAFEHAKEARAAGIDGKIGAWSNEWSEGFKRGQLATEMMGAWLGGHLKNWIAPETKGLWRSAQLPGGSWASYGGSFYGIPKKAAHKAEAWDFIKYLTMDKGQQIEAFRNVEAFPSLIAAQNDDFLNQPIEFLGGQKARQLWKVAADHIVSTDVDKYDSTAQDIVNAELDKVLEQGKDIKTALADAKAQIKRRVRR